MYSRLMKKIYNPPDLFELSKHTVNIRHSIIHISHLSFVIFKSDNRFKRTA